MKQVIQCYLTLNEVAVYVFLYPICCDHGHLKRLPASSHPPEGFKFVSQYSIIVFVYHILVHGKFHFT